MTRYIGILDGKAGAYGLHVPDLPGCTAMGETFDSAYSDAVEAMRLWAQDALADGETLPEARDMDSLRKDWDVARYLADGATFVVVPLTSAGRVVELVCDQVLPRGRKPQLG